ncbi:MAG: putative sugar nucleotidyl transferase [Candidatus Kapaibacterium sp.]
MICLFEDQHVEGFYPLSATRHVATLLCGGFTPHERAAKLLHTNSVLLHGREYLRPIYRSNSLSAPTSEQVTFINGRLRIEPDFLSSLPSESGWIIRREESVIAARLKREQLSDLNYDDSFLDFSRVEGLRELEFEGGELYHYLWEMIAGNNEAIVADSQILDLFVPEILPAGVSRVGGGGLYFGEDVSVAPGVVFDTTDGPIILCDGVKVMANSVIQGPCFIGANSTVKIGAKIYHGTSIGPWCKVGGEIENSIILGYSNKQHDGFLGHSYLGAWVNLGADTNTSDLKNNYGMIRVTLRGEEIDTGQMFLGALIGDHSKSGINTMLNTGTVVGPFANIFGGGFPPKEISSYAWCNVSEIVPYRLDKALELAERVMKRRNVDLTPEERGVLEYLYRIEHGEERG